jgi:hypothetical protein
MKKGLQVALVIFLAGLLGLYVLPQTREPPATAEQLLNEGRKLFDAWHHKDTKHLVDLKSVSRVTSLLSAVPKNDPLHATAQKAAMVLEPIRKAVVEQHEKKVAAQQAEAAARRAAQEREAAIRRENENLVQSRRFSAHRAVEIINTEFGNICRASLEGIFTTTLRLDWTASTTKLHVAIVFAAIGKSKDALYESGIRYLKFPNDAGGYNIIDWKTGERTSVNERARYYFP